MQFKIDENIHPDALDCLRQHGHDALSIWDQQMQGAADADVAAVCCSEQRTLITFDLDFADIRSYPPDKTPGIIVLRLGSQSRLSVLGAVMRLMPMLEQMVVAGHLWVVDERTIRIRGGPGESS